MTGTGAPAPQPLRVAIVGAGPAGLAAAWGLTQPLAGGALPNVSVTVYERSWRAGGKCGSSRLPPSHRIVQNGTHYMFGVYFNTLKMVTRAHNEIQDTRFGNTGDFVPRNLIALKHSFGGAWTNWKLELPPRGAGFPSFEGAEFVSPEQYLSLAFRWLKDYLTTGSLLPPSGVLGLLIDELIKLAMQIAADPSNATLMKLLADTLWVTRNAAQYLLSSKTDLKSVRARMLIDFMATLVLGILADGVMQGQIAQVDAWDFADWMAHHGAQAETCASPLVTAWYDSVAAFENGDPTRPRLSAAAVLQTVVPALVAYRGSFAYQMKSEVGEAFIAPVYEALRRRGVNFRFMHELREIVPDATGADIERLLFDVPRLPNQPPGSAETALATYSPLAEFTLANGTKRVYWPPEPNAPFAFVGRIDLANPHALRPFGPAREEVKREAGTHFDHVILAIPHSAFPRVAPKLVSQKPAWTSLVDKLPAVETMSLRLWVGRDFADLKWDPDPADVVRRPVLSAYDPHFNTWEDSGQQLELHTWPPPAPKSIATVFGPLPGTRIAPRTQLCEWFYTWIQRWRARSAAKTFLNHHVKGLWPGLVDTSGAFRWTDLVPAEVPPDALQQQWIVANSGANERYTHAAPGTFAFRLKSKQTGYTNLSVAGEWTQFWPATANVELTVISGLRAAYDILGVSTTIPSEKGFFPS